MKKTTLIALAALCLPLLLASCGTSKNLSANGGNPSAASVAASDGQQSAALQQLHFVQKVFDNQVYARNIVGNMSFNIKAKDKDMTVPGALRMRKDEVIRLQLFVPLLGTEVGRLEFTPDYVLIVNRMQKEYAKASYSQLPFLQQNGITFYTLQALFWNQLLIPGQQQVTDATLTAFTATLEGDTAYPVTLTDKNLTYTWTADKTTGRIVQADVAYKSGLSGASALQWQYGDFRSVGVKQFPARQTFQFTTSATKTRQQATVSISMSKVGTDSDWEPLTTVSSKYKKVEAQDLLAKIISL